MSIELTPYYSISASLLLKENADIFFIRKEVRLNIVLNSHIDLNPKLYSILNSLENEYIISLSGDLLNEVDDLQYLFSTLYLLLSLHSYVKIEQVIPVYADVESHEIISTIEKIKQYFNEQGLFGTKFPIFNYSINGIQTIDNCSLFIGQDYKKSIDYIFSKNYELLTIAFRNEINDLAVINNLEKKIIFEIRGSVYENDIPKLNIENRIFESEILLWRKRVSLYQDFLSLSKKVQQKEYYAVLHWYQKEYEVLPLWYKRFGHIIKVIMGKRSFSSLFAKHVKNEKL